jgi:hypothetical protein
MFLTQPFDTIQSSAHVSAANAKGSITICHVLSSIARSLIYSSYLQDSLGPSFHFPRTSAEKCLSPHYKQ